MHVNRNNALPVVTLKPCQPFIFAATQWLESVQLAVITTNIKKRNEQGAKPLFLTHCALPLIPVVKEVIDKMLGCLNNGTYHK
jgi:hypothetical protein